MTSRTTTSNFLKK